MTVAGDHRTGRREQSSAKVPVSAAGVATAAPGAPATRPTAVSAAPRTERGGTIRSRLVGIIALPVLAVLVLLGYVTSVEVSNYQASTASTRSVTLALAVRSLMQELQSERGLTAGLLGGNVGFRNEIPPVRQRVDQQRATVEHAVAGGGEVEDRVGKELRELDGLPAIRSGADTGSAGRAETFRFFTDRIAKLSRLDLDFDQATDPVLRRYLTTLDALGDIEESTAQERAFLNGVFSAGGFAKDEFLQFAAMRTAKELAMVDFAQHATPGQRAANDYIFDTGAAREAAYFEQVALSAADGRHLQVNPQSWWSALTTVLDGVRHLQQHVGSEVEARAAMRQREATRDVGVLVALVLLCLAGTGGLVVLATRSITRPLAALAAEARALAGHRLPTAVRLVQAGGGDVSPQPPAPVPVPARASTEIRSVTNALDQVQAVAYALAIEQAMLRRSITDSLANLGRRSQNLLRRQLGFITTLEREEADPTGLANLFELDHLATRMRRNAESLLVLVGAASPRQWSAPLPIADVIRAAISEVEEYRRVQLRRVDDAWVNGAVVGGVAHMLAELIENGLNFSPPESDVEIQGRRVGDGYLIAVMDQGIGMSADDLAVANARIRGETDFVSAPSRYLGHHVVGQLAREMSIDVQLAPSSVVGVTARLALPASLLATQPETDRVGAVTGSPVEPASSAAAAAPASSAAAALSAESVRHPAQAQRALSPSSGPSRATGARPTPAVDPVPVPIAVSLADAPTAAYPLVTGEVQPSVAGGGSGAAAGRGTAVASEGERTANGLRKRLSRSRRSQPAESAAESAAEQAPTGIPTGRSERGEALDDSPNEVRARLTALRAGVLRGETERPAPAQPPRDSATTEIWRNNDG